MSIVIKVENISKIYRLGEIGTGTISHDLNIWWHKIRGRPNPYSIIGQVNDRTIKSGALDFVFALQDINFEVTQGEVLGIIGRNGAGKSTLLKILSKTTTPTTGKIKVKGRIASLLEVGTGFHPELSGRENIYLNGAILGMNRNEINKKFDQIVDFSGVERYIDTPVKRYSSGMYVRLAFAVAAHLEPEILIVDEVLAVGDAEFQRKCLGKMKEASENDGRTVLFVSHNLQAISAIGKKSVLLENGKLIKMGNTDQILNHYLSSKCTNLGLYERPIVEHEPMILKAKIKTSNANYSHICGEALELEVYVNLPFKLRNGAFAFQILNNLEQPIVHSWIFNSQQPILNKKGINILRCKLPNLRIYMGEYKFRLILAEDLGNSLLEVVNEVCSFNVEMFNHKRDYKWETNSCIYIEDFEWEVL